MRKLFFLLPLFAAALGHGQNVRFTAPFPSISSQTSTPFLVANIPPNSPVLAVCHSPANQVPCTNYATTYTGGGSACPNGSQDTPDPNALTSACQSTGDAQGNIGFWAPAGTYDYTVCVGLNCYGPYTVTLGGSGGGGSGTVTSVAVGNLAPVFTSSVATATTTPSVSYTLSSAAANTIFGNCTGGPSSPAYCLLTTAMLPFTYTGNTTKLATSTGSLTSGHCAQFDASGNVVDSGGVCGGGGGGSPGGSNTQVQYNNSGSFGGISNVLKGSWLASQGVTSAPVFQTKFVADVRDYSGADWCAQVNAADTAFLGSTAVLYVPSAMSGLTACTTSITLTSGHALEFGSGSFDLGLQSGRAGINVPLAAQNVDIGGESRSATSLYYTSHNIVSNAFPMGSAIALSTNVGCTSFANAANNIRVHDLHIIDRNTGSALNGSTFNPSAIAGYCLNNLTIDNNQFTDIKGNAAITVDGSWSTFTTASNYQDRDNIFDGTTGGGGGEFTADNSANWTNFYMLNNNISYYPCGIGVAHGFHGLVAGNIADMTLKAAFGQCAAIALGSADDTVGDLQASNNVVLLGNVGGSQSAQTGIGMFPKPGVSGNQDLSVIGNVIRMVSGSSFTGISINGTLAGNNPPAEIVRDNYVSTDIPTAVSGVFNHVEVSGNTFDAAAGNITLFNCTGATSIQTGGSIQVFGNHISGPTPGAILGTVCSDASFATRQFQEWDNTVKDGNPNSYSAATGALGKPVVLSWTPGTIAAYTSTSDQVVTVTQAIPGDTVKIVNANGSSNWLSLPSGVIASGYVSAANTVTFNITNTTSASVTINGGLLIQSFAFVDRPPNNAQSPAYKLDGSAAHTTISASGQITSTVSTGTAPLVIASTTNVPNLNASSLNGATFAAPGAIGGTTPAAGTFTALSSTSGALNGSIGATTPNTGAFTSTTVGDGSFGSLQTNAPSACETSFGTTTLNTGATTTDTGLSCLPANAVIDAVVYRITTTITTSANFVIGDATTSGRFCGTQSTLTSGTTGICFVQADQTGAAGPRQASAAKVRVTLNANPGAGAIRLIVYYHTWTAPTS